MTRGQAHPAELRAEAVAAVLAGAAMADVARRFGVSKGTLGNWLATVDEQRLEQLGTEKRSDLQVLIARYLEVGFQAMIAQAEVFGDPAYCRTQSANDLAISHGVLGDKLAGVAATAQALGLIGPQAAAATDDGSAEPRGLDSAGPPEAAAG